MWNPEPLPADGRFAEQKRLARDSRHIIDASAATSKRVCKR